MLLVFKITGLIMLSQNKKHHNFCYQLECYISKQHSKRETSLLFWKEPDNGNLVIIIVLLMFSLVCIARNYQRILVTTKFRVSLLHITKLVKKLCLPLLIWGYMSVRLTTCHEISVHLVFTFQMFCVFRISSVLCIQCANKFKSFFRIVKFDDCRAYLRPEAN